MVRDLLASLARILTWWVVVAPWEQALRIRLGKNVRLLPAGCHFVIPFFDRIYRQAIRRRTSTVGPLTLTTSDRQTLIISGYVSYEIRDIVQLYQSISQAIDTIDCEVMAHISEFVTTHTLEECTPHNATSYVVEHIQLLERYGLGDVTFFISNFAYCKTYRFITGEVRSWMYNSGQLDTDNHETPGARVIH